MKNDVYPGGGYQLHRHVDLGGWPKGGDDVADDGDAVPCGMELYHPEPSTVFVF